MNALLVSPGPEGDFAHTLSKFVVFHDGEQCGESQHGLAQLKIRDMSGKERSNPFCNHARGRKHTGKKRKLQICQRCGGYPPVQRDSLERTRQAPHSHFRF